MTWEWKPKNFIVLSGNFKNTGGKPKFVQIIEGETLLTLNDILIIFLSLIEIVTLKFIR